MNKTKMTLIAVAVAAIFANDANAFGRDKKETAKETPAPVVKTAPAAPAVAPAPVISQPAAPVAAPAPAPVTKEIKFSPGEKVVPAPEKSVTPAPAVTADPKPVAKSKPAPTPEQIEKQRAEAAAKAEAKAKAKAEKEAKAKADREARREHETLAWMNAHPLDHYQCGEQTAWNRISASGYTRDNAPQSVKDLNAKQLNDCQSNIDKMKASVSSAAKSTQDTVVEAAGTASDSTSAFFKKFKDSLQNGATQKTCSQAEQSMGQCR